MGVRLNFMVGVDAHGDIVDLFDPVKVPGRDVDVATIQKLGLASREVTAEADSKTKVAKPLWPWLILAALAIVLLEWFVYNRKVQF